MCYIYSYAFISGLLHVGDIIKEVNGVEVRTPEELQSHMKKSVGSITLKIIPSYTEPFPTQQVHK